MIRLVCNKLLAGFILWHQVVRQNLAAGYDSGINISGRESENLRFGTRKTWKDNQRFIALDWNWLTVIRCGLLWDRCVLGQTVLCSWGKSHRAWGMSADHTLSIWGNKDFLEGLWSAQLYVTPNTLYREHQGFLFLPYNDSMELYRLRDCDSENPFLMVTQAVPDASVSPTSSTLSPAFCTVQHEKCWRPARLSWKLRSSWEEKIEKYKTVQKSP